MSDFPKAEVVTLAPVGVPKPHPQLKTEHVQSSLKEYLQQRTQYGSSVSVSDVCTECLPLLSLVAEGDTFSVYIEGAGDVVYRIMALQPQNSKKIDSSLREIIWQVSLLLHTSLLTVILCLQTKPVNYPLPCEPPPSPLLPPPPFFSCLLPPGLKEHCLTLFSLLLPLMYSDPKARPSRTPAILVSGMILLQLSDIESALYVSLQVLRVWGRLQ